MSALLEVQGLETAYGSSQVLFGIDLQVESGQVATLLGRNGMGKTTTAVSYTHLDVYKRQSLRTKGVYFIMITLAFAQMLYYIAVSVKAYGGDDGLSLASRSTLLPGVDLADDRIFYFVVLVLSLIHI